jgi:hypothetical protein
VNLPCSHRRLSADREHPDYHQDASRTRLMLDGEPLTDHGAGFYPVTVDLDSGEVHSLLARGVNPREWIGVKSGYGPTGRLTLEWDY